MERKSFYYNDQRITFRMNGNLMVNLTMMVKAFPGRRLDHFLETKQTKDFIETLKSKYPGSCILESVRGRYGGTWAHELVGLKLAAWLSPVFEVWQIEKTRDLLNTGIAVLDEKKEPFDINTLSRRDLAQMVLDSENEKLELKEAIKEAQPAVDYIAAAVKLENTDDLIGKFAKYIAQATGFSIGQNRMFDWMVGKYCYKRSGQYYPYQRYVEKGWLTVKERTIERGDITFQVTTMRITALGRVHVMAHFIKEHDLKIIDKGHQLKLKMQIEDPEEKFRVI